MTLVAYGLMIRNLIMRSKVDHISQDKAMFYVVATLNI